MMYFVVLLSHCVVTVTDTSYQEVFFMFNAVTNQTVVGFTLV